MRILSVDIGVGTQEILLYDEDTSIENCTRFILPSPTRIFANRVRKATKMRKNLVFSGCTMGGGPVSNAINNHLKHGLRVMMTEESARTIRDDIEQVKSMGIEIIEENEVENLKSKGYEHIFTYDFDVSSFLSWIRAYGIDFDFDVLAIAVQDHGFTKGIRDRINRFSILKELIHKNNRDLRTLAWIDNVPSHLTRMKSLLDFVKSSISKKILLLDTGIAAMLGILSDPSCFSDPAILVNVGNGHTICCTIEDRRILGMFEHHSRFITPKKFDLLVKRLCEGTLSNEDVLNDGGHGALVFETVDYEKVRMISVVGPNRELLRTCNKVSLVSPKGDTMMSGPFGLVYACKYNLGRET